MSAIGRDVLRIMLLAAAFAIGTWIAGWWAVPLLGAIWGVLRRGMPRFGSAFAAAAIAWALLLAYDGVRGPMDRLSTVMGGLFSMPGAVVLLVTVVFAALLAGCAAQLTGFVPARQQR
jgi:hypothetical protein